MQSHGRPDREDCFMPTSVVVANWRVVLLSKFKNLNSSPYFSQPTHCFCLSIRLTVFLFPLSSLSSSLSHVFSIIQYTVTQLTLLYIIVELIVSTKVGKLHEYELLQVHAYTFIFTTNII